MGTNALSTTRTRTIGPLLALLLSSALSALAQEFADGPVVSCGAATIPAATLVWESTGPYGTSSSPRATDLNGDGVLDVVVGHGVERDFDRSESRGYVVAIDGATGSRLWRIDGHGAVFGTAALADVSGDGVDDVFIGGRGATLLAVDGARGTLLWSFETEGTRGRGGGTTSTARQR